MLLSKEYTEMGFGQMPLKVFKNVNVKCNTVKVEFRKIICYTILKEYASSLGIALLQLDIKYIRYDGQQNKKGKSYIQNLTPLPTLVRNPSRDEECLNLETLTPTADWSDITRQPGHNKNVCKHALGLHKTCK